MGVILANPDQSKHLETATLRLNALPIDLVHLRSESYTEESRIPTIQVGTPEEDASRRDFTINSLFYNINLQKVEDFTGKGIDDLKKGIIRTPLDPQVTFMDGVLPFPFSCVQCQRCVITCAAVAMGVRARCISIACSFAWWYDGPLTLIFSSFMHVDKIVPGDVVADHTQCSVP